MARRLSTALASRLEETFREAVCPKTLAEPAEEEEATMGAAVTLGDALLVDGTASVRRLTRSLSNAISSKVDGRHANNLARRESRPPPPPPPPIPLDADVREALARAELRRASALRLAEVSPHSRASSLTNGQIALAADATL